MTTSTKFSFWYLQAYYPGAFLNCPGTQTKGPTLTLTAGLSDFVIEDETYKGMWISPIAKCGGN